MPVKIISIVPAAGIGKRFDETGKKIFHPIRGTPLLIHSIRRLRAEPFVEKIIPVLHRDYIEEGRRILREFECEYAGPVIEGGKERQDSINNALNYVKENLPAGGDETMLMVHDGARPYIPPGTTEKLVEALQEADGAIPALRARDTLKTVDEAGYVVSTLDRDRIRAVQTPQLFRYNVLMDAYERACREGFYGTDDASVVEHFGGRIRVIEGSGLNIKITTTEDALVMGHILEGTG